MKADIGSVHLSDFYLFAEEWYYYMISVILSVISLFLLITGHRYFKAEMFMHGFLFSLFCFVVLLLKAQAPSAGLYVLIMTV